MIFSLHLVGLSHYVQLRLVKGFEMSNVTGLDIEIN